jgi:Putative transposase, YhgA-like
MGVGGILPLKKHDRSFRLLFSQPRLMEDLIRRFIGHGEPWVDDLDFATLERVSTAHVSDALDSRDGDLGWRIRLRSAPVVIYLLLEFQSEPQRFMALRQSVYLGLFYQQLLKQGHLTSDGWLPLVLTIVVYNGKVRWLAPRELAELIRGIEGPLAAYVPRLWYRLIEMEAYEETELQGSNLVALLIRLERGRSRDDLNRVIRDLADAVPGPDEGGLRRAFVVWIRRVLLAGKGEGDVPELVDLEDFRTMLLETVEEWNREIEARGHEKGLEQGRRDLLLRLLEVKFGALDERTRARVSAADSQRLLKWGERVLSAERLSDVFRR